MKKLLLVSAVAALSVPTAFAGDNVKSIDNGHSFKLYGRASADLTYEEDGDISMDDGTTRLGVKGSAPLTAGLDGIYGLEWSLDLDDTSSTNLSSRDTYIGIQGDTFGTLKGGRLTAIDDGINFTNPSDYWKSGVLGYDAGRVNNALAYMTPSYNGLTFMGMYKLSDSDEGTESSDFDNDGSFGVGAAYDQGPVKAGVTYVSVSDSDIDALRFGAAYDLTSQFTLSGLYQIADFDTDDEENSYIVAAEYDVPNSKWSTYLEYDGVTNAGGVKDADENVISAGGTYAFSKGISGRVYAGVTDTDNDDADKFGFGTGLTYKF